MVIQRLSRYAIGMGVNTYTSDIPAADTMNSGPISVHNRGVLRNNNPGGDPSTSPRCGAKTRAGSPCRAPAIWSVKAGRYTRCRRHGGASTGPRTPEGLEKCRRTQWKHGQRSAEAMEAQRASRSQVRMLKLKTKELMRRVRNLHPDQHSSPDKLSVLNIQEAILRNALSPL